MPAHVYPVPRRVRYGDLWQLGRHRLLCGDSADPVQVARLIAGEKAALTITSPPYNLGKSTMLAGSAYLRDSEYLGQSDRRSPAEYLDLLCAATSAALAVSETVILNLQLLAGNKIAFTEFLYRFRNHLADIAVWDKGHAAPAMAKNVMTNRFEFLLFFSARQRGTAATRTIHTADFRGTVANVYQGPPQRHNPYFSVHAATFPLHLPLWLMETFDSRRGTVFDPFLGTGTTLMDAEQTGRKCFGIEIDPMYCDIILDRFVSVTEKNALSRIDRR